MDGLTNGLNDTPVRRYGEATLSGNPAPRYGQATGKHINWGRVIKGAVLVTGAILVAVATFYGVMYGSAALVTALNNIPVVGQALAAVAHGILWTAGFVGAAATDLWSFVSTQAVSLWNSVFAPAAGAAAQTAVDATQTGLTSIGFGEGAKLTASQVGTVSMGAAAIATTAVAAKLTLPVVKNTLAASYTDPNIPVAGRDNSDSLAVAQGHSASSTAAKIGHHTVDNVIDDPATAGGTKKPRTSWQYRMAASSAYQRSLAEGGSHADAVRAAHDGVMESAKSRNVSYSQQLMADRAALEAALANPER